MTSFPSVEFSAWRRWQDVNDSGWTELNETGSYLLARFAGSVPAGSADPTTAEVFYIGECHGRASCLRNRLRQFSDSAGFSGHQKSGHYAAWRYPDEFEEDVVTPQPSAGPTTSSDRVYVAVCSYTAKPGWPRDARGAFPVYVESAAIWAYVIARGRLPPLNNSGWQGGTDLPAPPQLESLVHRLLSASTGVAVNARDLLEALAQSLGYKPARRIYESKYDTWTEVERHLGGGLWLGVGWRDETGTREFCVDLYDGDEPLLRLPAVGSTASTEAEVLTMLGGFWDYWHQP